MEEKVLFIRNARIIDAESDFLGSVLVEGGQISAVIPQGKAFAVPQGAEVVEAEGLVLEPSFVDMHVHFRYPGQEHKEDLDSGISAAVAGGYGAVVAMPNTTPVISSREMAERVMKEAAWRGKVDFFQAASLTRNFEGSDVSHLAALERGSTPVVSEDGHDVESAAVMLEAMRICASKGIIVSCHSEDVSLCNAAKPFRSDALALMRQYGIPAWGEIPQGLAVPHEVEERINWNLARANELLALAEDIATERNIRIARDAGCRIHIAHCSTEFSLEAVRRAKASGLAASVEATPHHISLAGDRAPNIRALVNPPLRPQADVDALIAGIADGTVDAISTDHAPHTLDDKAAGSPGFTGLETAFSVCNSVLVRGGKISAQKLSALMSLNPARLLGLERRGLVKEGFLADLVLLNPEKEFTVDANEFYSKGKATPQNGRRLFGTVEAVIYKGKVVMP